MKVEKIKQKIVIPDGFKRLKTGEKVKALDRIPDWRTEKTWVILRKKGDLECRVDRSETIIRKISPSRKP